MISRILGALAYLALYAVTTVLGSYFTFPLEKMREYIEYKVNASGRLSLEIESIEREGMGDLALSGVTLGVKKSMFARRGAAAGKGGPAVPAGGAGGPAAKEGEEGEPGKDGDDEGREGKAAAAQEEYSYIAIDNVVLSFSPLQLLSAEKVVIGVQMELLGGTIADGEIEFGEAVGYAKPALRFPSMTGLALGETEFFGALFSAILPSVKTNQMSGTLDSGSVVIEPVADEEGGVYYSGGLDLELSDITALSPILVNRMKTGEVVEVPLTDMKLGKCRFKLRLDRKDRIEELDKVKTKFTDATAMLFEKGECKGESLDYFVRQNSYILFPKKVGMFKGTMDFWTKLAFSPDYFDEERKEGGKVVTKNTELGQGIEFDRMWQSAKDADGYYWMHCTGTLSQPKCRRGLPEEERVRLKALKEAEKQKEREEKAKGKEAKGKAAADKGEPDKKASKKTSLLDKRKEEARKRAERQKEERDKKARQVPDEPRTNGHEAAGPGAGEAPGAGGVPETPEAPMPQPDVVEDAGAAAAHPDVVEVVPQAAGAEVQGEVAAPGGDVEPVGP